MVTSCDTEKDNLIYVGYKYERIVGTSGIFRGIAGKPNLNLIKV